MEKVVNLRKSLFNDISLQERDDYLYVYFHPINFFKHDHWLVEKYKTENNFLSYAYDAIGWLASRYEPYQTI